jgi:hypothetical protein
MSLYQSLYRLFTAGRGGLFWGLGLILDSFLQIYAEKEFPFSLLMALVGLCHVTVTLFR